MGSAKKKWDYRLSPPARKHLGKLEHATSTRIVAALAELSKDPFGATQVKRLKGSEFYRLRVGDYRVVCLILRDERMLYITSIRHILIATPEW